MFICIIPFVLVTVDVSTTSPVTVLYNVNVKSPLTPTFIDTSVVTSSTVGFLYHQLLWNKYP